MGAAALAADVGSVCVPLVVGGTVGSAVASTHERCGQRICVVEGAPTVAALCKEVATCTPELTFPVRGCVHSAQASSGVVGIFRDNEPVVAVRARTLPYFQAIGHSSPDRPHLSWAARQFFPSGHIARDERMAISKSPSLCKFDFDDFVFTLPGLSMHDNVVVAFGTRTVVRLPFFSNAPLDFDVLGTMQIPLWQLLQTSQPSDLLVPIQAPGDQPTSVARISLSFEVPETHAPPTKSSAPSMGTEPERIFLFDGPVVRCDSEDVDREIQALENQLRLLKRLPLQHETRTLESAT